MTLVPLGFEPRTLGLTVRRRIHSTTTPDQISRCALVKITPGWNAPQGVENVHTLCAGKPESDVIYISVRRFERAFGPEKRYIGTSYY